MNLFHDAPFLKILRLLLQSTWVNPSMFDQIIHNNLKI